MPEVGGGPSTRILIAGSAGLTSFQVCAVFGALAERIGGERLVDVGLGQVHRRAVDRLDDGQAVDPDRHFDDLLDAIGDAAVIFALLDLRARR